MIEKKDIITKMKLLRDYRNDRISDRNGKVLDVKYLGNIDLNLEEKNIDEKNFIAVYLIIEQYEQDGKFFEVEQYYSENFKTGDIRFLAGNNRSDGIDEIYLSSDYTDNDALREYLQKEINFISKEGELDLAIEEQIEQIAKELGLSPEEVEALIELNLDVEEKDKIDNEKQENSENGNEELTEEQTEEVLKVSGKQEVNINAKFDKKNTLRKELGLGSEYKNITVVYSEKLQQINGNDKAKNHSPLAFVAVRNDGTSEVINSLELDDSSGRLPTKESIKIDSNGTAREDRNTLSRYKIAGKNSYLSVERGQYGEMKVYHGQKTKEENRSVEFQLETRTLRPTKYDMREMQRPNHGKYHVDDIENEFEKHASNGEKELKNSKDYDGDKNTATHVHEIEEIQELDENAQIYIENEIEKWAEQIMEDYDVQNAFTENEVREMIKNYWQKDKGNIENSYSVKETKEEFDKIKFNIEQDATIFKTKNRGN